MRPKPLKWRDEERGGGLIAFSNSSLGNYEISVRRGGTQWVLWIGRTTKEMLTLLKCLHYDTKAEAKLAGEQIWRLMVMELLEGDE
jgi:hypothetical protein